MTMIIVGAPRSGKSTLARELRGLGYRTYCTDPLSLVKDPEQQVTYLPEGLDWSEGSRFVADQWLPLKGQVVIEGVGTVRALRKLLEDGRSHVLNDATIVRLTRQFDCAVTKAGQRSMAKAIDSIWAEISAQLAPITEYR